MVPLTLCRARAGFRRSFLFARPHIMLKTILTFVRRRVPITRPNLPIRRFVSFEVSQFVQGVKQPRELQF